MKITDLITMTLRNLLRRKTRTMLTITGVIVGTCSIVVMVSLGIGMTQAMEASLQQMGDLTVIDVYSYGGGASSSGEVPKLNDQVLAQIQQMEGVQAVTPNCSLPGNMNLKFTAGRNDRYEMMGYNVQAVYSDALDDFGYAVTEGQLLEPSTGKTINVLMGSEAAYQFMDTKRSWRNNTVSPYPDENGNIPDPFIDPTKDKITLKMESNQLDDEGKPKYKTITYDVKVTGVLEKNERDYSTTYSVFMDIKDVRKLYEEYKRVNKIREDKNSSAGNSNNSLDSYDRVRVKAVDIDSVSAVNDAIKEMGFETSSLESIREPMQKQMQQQQIFLGSLGAISLLVAAIGITNTMIMSIYERTREIGVMKVLGCKLGNIRTVFLMEAGLIGFWGGVFGVGISWGISRALNHFVASGGGDGSNFLTSMLGGFGGMGGDLSVIPVWLAVLAVIFATIIGLVSGFYPANRAVKISALEAIKHE